MKFNPAESRYKLIFVPYDLVLESLAFCAKRECQQGGSRLQALNNAMGHLPDGMEVCEANKAYTRNGFFFRLYHPSFDVVPEFGEIPEVQWGNLAHSFSLNVCNVCRCLQPTANTLNTGYIYSNLPFSMGRGALGCW